MSRQDARRIIVAYDVADDSRRTRVAQVLQRYGDRVQYSVFIVDVGSAGLMRMRSELLDTMDRAVDSVLLCDLGPASGLRSQPVQLGVGRPVTGVSNFLV